MTIDHEITDQIDPGANTLTFTPNSMNQLSTVQAHFEVVYSQQDPDRRRC